MQDLGIVKENFVLLKKYLFLMSLFLWLYWCCNFDLISQTIINQRLGEASWKKKPGVMFNGVISHLSISSWSWGLPTWKRVPKSSPPKHSVQWTSELQTVIWVVRNAMNIQVQYVWKILLVQWDFLCVLLTCCRHHLI